MFPFCQCLSLFIFDCTHHCTEAPGNFFYFLVHLLCIPFTTIFPDFFADVTKVFFFCLFVLLVESPHLIFWSLPDIYYSLQFFSLWLFLQLLPTATLFCFSCLPLHMKLTAAKYYCSDLGNPPQRAFAIRTSMNFVIFFIYGES